MAACDGSISLEGKRYEAETNGQKMVVNIEVSRGHKKM